MFLYIMPCKVTIKRAKCQIYSIKKEITDIGYLFVENIGIEPMTSCMPCKRSSQLS